MITLALLGLVGGLITGVSPCVLPMLPIIFFAGGSGRTNDRQRAATTAAGSSRTGAHAAADGSENGGGVDVLVAGPVEPAAKKRRDLRPVIIIAGLVTSFSVFTLLGSTILSALGLPDGLLRWIGLGVLALVGLGLIIPALGHLIEKPFYRLPQLANAQSSAFVFGLGLGTLYVPCAGPILAAITVAGASGRIGWGTVVLTVSFAVGAALPLLVFAAAGAKIRTRIDAYRQRAKVFRTIGGVVMIVLAVALAFNATDALQRALPAYTGGLEKKLAENPTVQGELSPFDNGKNADLAKCLPGSAVLASCGPAPEFVGTQRWFNTPGDRGLTLAGLKGKVVLIDFFAYSCINCQRDAPYLKAWNAAYADHGLQVVGVHSPEFAFEKDAGNLQDAITKEGLSYPVVQDNDLKTWTDYRNRYWPAKYLIDATGTVRAITFGEGNYAQTENLIRQLLTDRDPGETLPQATDPARQGVTPADQRTQEIYLSPYRTQTGYNGPGRVRSGPADYQPNQNQPVNSYSLGGHWTAASDSLRSSGQSTIRLHYRAANVYNVLAGQGTVTVSRPGKPDTSIQVSGTPNLYPLVQEAAASDETITISYGAGIRAYTFTFG